MLDTLQLLPIEFWLVVICIAVGIGIGIGRITRGTGLPLLAVIGTVTVWYVGDVLYNDYAENHLKSFTPETLSSAWLQVTAFMVTLLVATPVLHNILNRDCVGGEGRMYRLYLFGSDDLETQSTLRGFAKICVGVWLGLIALAPFNVGSEALYFTCSFLGRPTYPFMRARVGGGLTAAVFALATNFQVLVAAGFGIVAALARDPRIRLIGFVGCLMTWPFFLLDRTRNTMLAACAPAVFSWVFLRLRIPLTAKIAILCVALFAGDTWLRFVMEARNSGHSVTSYFFESDSDEIVNNETRHEGLNMYEELCWLDQLMKEGLYAPNWGERYFAEIVNPIPRGVWPDKPTIGIEYAIARGQQFDQAGESQAGVGATISTGMIGQGVDNFGPVFGPLVSGIIMSLWVVLLARIDLHSASSWRLPLYAIGLVLTFNLGRDVTLLVLYPFVFGLVLMKIHEYQQSNLTFNRRGFRYESR